LKARKPKLLDFMIEETCWSEDLPDLVGGKGTAAGRRTALRKAYLANRTPLGHG
jgi:hypothetical protein